MRDGFRMFVLLAVVIGGLIVNQPLIALADASGVQNTEVLTQKVDLKELVSEAMQKNPGLMEKKARYEAFQSKVISAWLPEDPEIGADVEGQAHLFDFNSRTDLQYSATQKILFPTKLFLKGMAASKEAKMAYQDYKEEEKNLIWHMERPYYELLLAKQTLKALQENKALLEQILKSAKARYESNQYSQTDLLKAEIEFSKNSIEIFDWAQKEHVAEAHFSHLLNRPLLTKYLISEDFEKSKDFFSHETLEAKALKGRPELKALELAVERAKLNRSLTNSEWLPDITARLESRQFKNEASIREHDTFIGVTVPFWSVLKGLGGVWRGSDQEVKEAEALYAKMKNEVLLEIHEAYAKVQSSQNALNIYENSILPQAKQQVEVGLASYEAGKIEFLVLIDAERTLKETQVQYYRYLSDYQMSLADLRLAVGGEL